jgi:hypothetical protein
MTVHLRHRPPLWELHAAFSWPDEDTGKPESYLAGMPTEDGARTYAVGHGWSVVGIK